MAEKQVIVKVKRQVRPQGAPYWEEFALSWRPAMNVIICLRDIAENPVTRDGKKTTPISYDSNCLEEVCGLSAGHRHFHRRFCRRRDYQSGAALQHASNRSHARPRTHRRVDAAGRRARLREFTELREGMPKRNSAHRIHRGSKSSSVETGHARLADRLESPLDIFDSVQVLNGPKELLRCAAAARVCRPVLFCCSVHR